MVKHNVTLLVFPHTYPPALSVGEGTLSPWTWPAIAVAPLSALQRVGKADRGRDKGILSLPLARQLCELGLTCVYVCVCVGGQQILFPLYERMREDSWKDIFPHFWEINMGVGGCTPFAFSLEKETTGFGF